MGAGKYGILPEQYADFATLRGDASDGLPGVKGVGEKTAATLLQQYGDIPGIVAAAEDDDSDLGPGPRQGEGRGGLPPRPLHVVAIAREPDRRPPDPGLPRPRRTMPVLP